MARKPATRKKIAARKTAARKTSSRKAPAKGKAAAGYRNIIVKRRQGALEIQFNRPEKLNAISIDMAQEITHALLAAETDRKVIGIILHGNERAFCAGADLGRMGSDPSERFDNYRARFNVAPNRNMFKTMCFFTKPIISAVEGYCLGGGLEIALWGDIIVAGEAAQLGLPETRHSLIPGGGGTQNLTRLIGPALAKELIWTARRINAAEARELRIVNHAVAKGKALAKAREIMAAIAQNGPLGVMMSKQAINRGMDMSRYNGFMQEGDLAHMLVFSEDRSEGLRAFAERRKPIFKGQ